MAQEDAQADGYYAEDEMGADELDLSFLDDEEKEEKKDEKKDGGTTPPAAPSAPAK